jgi:Fe-S cluster biogenesis protein NfuA
MATTTEPVGDAVLFERVQDLQAHLEGLPESPAKELGGELVSAVVQLYGEGLERLLAAMGDEQRAGLTADPLLTTLLLIHDLHPVPLAGRVQDALDSVRPYMESHGGDVELLSLQDGIATIRLRGSCRDCTASSVTLELAIKQALEEAAPDLEELIVEGMAQMPTQPPPDDGCAR